MSGVIDSTSERSARKELTAQGLTVSRLSEVAIQSEKNRRPQKNSASRCSARVLQAKT